jgi:hypothetical protein
MRKLRPIDVKESSKRALLAGGNGRSRSQLISEGQGQSPFQCPAIFEMIACNRPCFEIVRLIKFQNETYNPITVGA